ncbi:hypothetical protein DSO57_1012362 [Entomophthora muscae]|uniref:Uncharacterized protein n=1 Tax=Entomophthora muscae TaxID=34485 RepID=A0ACC2TH25_9FUNG|nr:hypothetical protein DSO57_1012362 [Entomophthora muscae]
MKLYNALNLLIVTLLLCTSFATPVVKSVASSRGTEPEGMTSSVKDDTSIVDDRVSLKQSPEPEEENVKSVASSRGAEPEGMPSSDKDDASIVDDRVSSEESTEPEEENVDSTPEAFSFIWLWILLAILLALPLIAVWIIYRKESKAMFKPSFPYVNI